MTRLVDYDHYAFRYFVTRPVRYGDGNMVIYEAVDLKQPILTRVLLKIAFDGFAARELLHEMQIV